MSFQKQNPKLKYRANWLGVLLIQKPTYVFSNKMEVDAKIRKFLDILYDLLAIVKKQNREIVE